MSNKLRAAAIVLVFVIVAAMLSITTWVQASPSVFEEQEKPGINDDPRKETYRLNANNTIYLPLVLRNGSLEPPWTIIVTEDFEGAFPGSGWVVGDITAGAYKWGKRTCRPYEGSNSAWAVGGGSSGAGLSCGSDYPNDVYTWMDYGPFDLTDATAAEMQFKFWANTEKDFDYICWGASTDSISYDGDCGSGITFGWFDEIFDLSGYAGEAQVWITFEFDSDPVTTKSEGAYVDDIEIRKCIHASCASPTSASQIPAQDGFATYKKSYTR